MGFSLIGNSGSSSSTVYDTSNTASQNPQQDQQGAGAYDTAINVSPLAQDGSTINDNESIQTYAAPITITSAGDLLGDSALAAFTQAAQAGDQASTGNAPAPSTLSSLLSGNAIYWILGALALLFLAHEK